VVRPDDDSRWAGRAHRRIASIPSEYEACQRVWGDRTSPPPLITAAFVSALAHPDFLVEMDAIAIVPE
jgi:enamine deaminase RidA (YjgF/YER057c/UK114 family)